MASILIPGQVADLATNFVPEVWGKWINDNSTRTNKFLNSGVVTASDQINQMLLQAGNGLHITIPHIHSVDLKLPTQDWNSKTDLEANGLASYTEEDVKFTDAQVFGNNDYDDYMTGAQTLAAISQQFVQYWANVDNRRIIQIINNTFLNEQIAAWKGYGIGTEDEFNAKDFVLAMAHMGDVADGKPTTMAVNSGTYNFMRQQNMVEFFQPSTAVEPIATYNGLTLITDDDIPLAADGTTCAYIFSNGAMSYNAVTAPVTNAIATVRDELHQGGITAISHKRVAVGHVFGTQADFSTNPTLSQWKNLIAGNSPVYAPVSDDSARQIRLIKYSFKIDDHFVIPGVNSYDYTPDSNGVTNPNGALKSSNSANGSSAASSSTGSSASNSGK